MAKFVVECQRCHRFLEAKGGWFGTKELKCACGERIILKGKGAQQATRECPNCHNEVVYDLSKGVKATCPICGTKLASADSLNSSFDFGCKQCGCILHASKNWSKPIVCPSCGAENDVQKNFHILEQKKSGEPVVIQYEGDIETIVWKHPITDFVTGSTLIVHHNQIAVFFRDGQMLDSFGPGRHALETDTLPLISKHEKLATSGMQPFHSEVYFVNTAVQTGLGWGTDPSLHDPGSNIHITLHSHGSFNLQVIDPRKLLGKYVGTTEGLTRKELFDVNGYFRSSVRGTIKSIMAKVISDARISVLQVDGELNRIAELLTDRLRNHFQDYGMQINEVSIEDIGLPDREEEPLFWKMKDQIAEKVTTIGQSEIDLLKAKGEQAVEATKAQTERYKEQLRTEAQLERQQQLGYTYQQERAFDAIEKLAENEGASSTINNAAMGVGMGVGFGLPMGAATGGAFNQILKSAFEGPQQQPYAATQYNGNMQNPGSQSVGGMPFGGVGNPGMRMSPMPERQDANSRNDKNGSDLIRKRFADLQSIKEFLSEEEYQQKRKEIIDSINK